MSAPRWGVSPWVIVALVVLVMASCAAFAAPAGSGWSQCTLEDEPAGIYRCSGAAQAGTAGQVAYYGRADQLCSNPVSTSPNVQTFGEGEALDAVVYSTCYSDDFTTETHDAEAAPWSRMVFISAEPPGESASAADATALAFEQQSGVALAYGIAFVVFAMGYVGGRMR